MRVLAACVVTLSLFGGITGCAPGGVTIPSGYEDLVQCESKVLEATTMHEIGVPGCNLQGSSVIFPDGYSLGVGEVGSVQVQQFLGGDGVEGPEYLIVNWGRPGVGVSKITPEGTSSWATSASALDLQSQQLRL